MAHKLLQDKFYKISVIIPTFNRGWCIRDAVNSVLNQNYQSTNKDYKSINKDYKSINKDYKSINKDYKSINKDYKSINKDYKSINKDYQSINKDYQSINKDYQSIEVIVVDDGSTDNTYEILKPFIEQGFIKLFRQDNKGVSAARNLGILKSCGEFVAFLDSDDLWLPNKLSCQMDFFEQYPEAMICQTEEIWIRNGKRVNPKRKHKKLSGMIFEPSLNLCLVSPSSVIMRRKFFEIKGLFDENLPACEDYDLWLRTSTDMPIWLVDKPCIIKRGGHDDQLSANHSLDKYRIISILNLLNNDSHLCTLNNKNFDKLNNEHPYKKLTSTQIEASLRVLREKCNIYSQGCFKRGKIEDAIYYSELEKVISSGVIF